METFAETLQESVLERTGQSPHRLETGSAFQERQNSAPSAGEFLSFKLGAEEYGIDILKVQEIRSYEESTRIAHAPSFVKGVVNLRGVIVPLVDLRLKFGLDQVDYNPSTIVIVLNLTKRIVGVVVDSVSDVLQLSAQHIKPPPQFSSAVDTAFITGIGSIQDRMMILMDIEGLMRSAETGLVDS